MDGSNYEPSNSISSLPFIPQHLFSDSYRTMQVTREREREREGSLECVNMCRFLQKVELARLEARLMDYVGCCYKRIQVPVPAMAAEYSPCFDAQNVNKKVRDASFFTRFAIPFL